METEHYETIVIGGGQAGLAVGYFLKQAERSFAILDASDRVGDSWRARWDSLRLYSPASRDGLPGMPFPAPPTSYPTAVGMGDYLEAYAAGFELPVQGGLVVERLTKEDDRYVATAGGRRFEAENVVVASGVFQKPYVPSFAGQLDPSIFQLHSNDYRNLSQLQDGPVLVVGAAHSGADLAYEAATEHDVILSGKDTGQLPVPLETRRGRL
jgi:putative flavoprotein involved in K+ transport